LDLAKAFDRLEWDFIATALLHQGYRGYFINLVKTCVSTPTFSVLVNGQPRLLFERNEVSAKAVTYRLTFLLLQLINCPTGFNLRCKIAI
jgi:hypothetical protein